MQNSLSFFKIILIGFLIGFILTWAGRWLIYLNGQGCVIGLSGMLGIIILAPGYIILVHISPTIFENGFTTFNGVLLLILQGFICSTIGCIITVFTKIIKRKISVL